MLDISKQPATLQSSRSWNQNGVFVSKSFIPLSNASTCLPSSFSNAHALKEYSMFHWSRNLASFIGLLRPPLKHKKGGLGLGIVNRWVRDWVHEYSFMFSDPTSAYMLFITYIEVELFYLVLELQSTDKLIS